MPVINLHKNNSYALAIFSLAAFINLSLFLFHGIKHLSDTDRYLSYADSLLDGVIINKQSVWYFSYTFFLSFFRLFTPNLIPIIIAQCLLSCIAATLLFKASYSFFNSLKSAIICSLLYLCFLKILDWNFYILTESLYCSCICFLLYFISRHYSTNKKTYLFIAWIIVVFLLFLRPTGITLFFPFLVYNYLSFLHFKLSNKSRLSLVLFSLSLLYFSSNYMIESFSLVENYLRGEVVFNISTLSYFKKGYIGIIPVPEDVFIPDTSISELNRGLLFFLNNPWFSFKLVLNKLFYFYFQYRPYYSTKHLFFNFICLIPSYLFLFKTLFSKKLTPNIKGFIWSYLALTTLMIAMTNVDWDGRFLTGLLPVVFCFGSYGFVQVFFKHKKTAS